jgi:nucleoside-diphosphate-sugar epimerase
MNILITGGSGFIGYSLAQFHAGKGDNVIILDSLYKSKKTIDEDLRTLIDLPNVTFHEVDLTKPVQVEIDEELDYVYHLAAINGTKLFYEIPYEVCLTNLLITINFLKFLENIKFRKLVFSSTSEVYAGALEYGLMDVPTAEDVPVVFPQPTNLRFSYASSKFVSEYLVIQFGKQFDKNVSVIRYHNIYGPRMGFNHAVPEIILRLLSGENPFPVYGADETRAFCYVDDAVEASYQVAASDKTNSEIVHIGDQEAEVNILDLTRMIQNILSIKTTLVPAEGLSGSVKRRCPDTTKLKKLTGFRIKTGLTEGLKRSIDWYQTHHEKN